MCVGFKAKSNRVDQPIIVVMPDIFSETLNQFLDAAKCRKSINFWFEPFPKQLNWVVLRWIRWQVKQMKLLMPLEILFNLLGFMNRRIIQDDYYLLIRCPLAQLGEKPHKLATVPFTWFLPIEFLCLYMWFSSVFVFRRGFLEIHLFPFFRLDWCKLRRHQHGFGWSNSWDRNRCVEDAVFLLSFSFFQFQFQWKMIHFVVDVNWGFTFGVGVGFEVLQIN